MEVGYKDSVYKALKLTPHIISLLAISLIFITLSFYDFDSILPDKYTFNNNEKNGELINSYEKDLRAAYAHFGDYFGGVLSGLFGFLGLIALLITIVFQSKELSKTTEAMQDQSNIFLIQRFENILYKKIEFYMSSFDANHLDKVWEDIVCRSNEYVSNRKGKLDELKKQKKDYDNGELAPGEKDNYFGYGEYEKDKNKLEQLIYEDDIENFEKNLRKYQKDVEVLYNSYLNIYSYIEEMGDGIKCGIYQSRYLLDNKIYHDMLSANLRPSAMNLLYAASLSLGKDIKKSQGPNMRKYFNSLFGEYIDRNLNKISLSSDDIE